MLPLQSRVVFRSVGDQGVGTSTAIDVGMTLTGLKENLELNLSIIINPLRRSE